MVALVGLTNRRTSVSFGRQRMSGRQASRHVGQIDKNLCFESRQGVKLHQLSILFLVLYMTVHSQFTSFRVVYGF
jgi:hypothetical protein